MALRSRIDRPPTWLSGRVHSQASSGLVPSAAPEPSALHSQLPKVSSTGRGAAVVPEVWTTIAVAPRSCGRGRAGAAAPSGASTTFVAPASGGSGSRRSTGTATAPEIRHACSAIANSRPGSSAIATRSPGCAPSAPAARRARSSSSAYVSVPSARAWGRLRAARGSQGSTSIARKVAFRRMASVQWTPAGEFEDIRYELSGDGIAKVTINRPEVRNAFRPPTVIELMRAFEAAREDESVGVIILTGEGPLACCAGGDQGVRGDRGYEEQPGSGVGRFLVPDLQVQMRRLPKPIVAMVAGYAVGGGHVLHLLCDLTIAADNAVFGQTGPRVGSWDGGFGASVLSDLVGPKKAKEIWFLCRQYDAEQALSMGLVNTAVPLDRLEEETVRWCRERLALSPFALRLSKASFRAHEDGYAGMQQLAHDANLLFYGSDEAREGREAYKQKRTPDYSKFPRRP